MRKGYKEIESKKMNIKVEKNSSNKKDKIKFFVWLLVLMFVYYQVFVLVSYTLGNEPKGSMWLYNGINKIITSIAPQSKETTEEYKLNIAALGDVYSSTKILNAAKTGGEYNFSDSFAKTKEFLAKYDVVLASLNTPIADAKYITSTSTVHNAPKELLTALKHIGITTLATANNHMMDKGETGVKTTIEQLQTMEINQIGLNTAEERIKPYIIEKNNIKIAVLSYMTTSNTKIAKGKEYLVNSLTEENIKTDMEYVKDQNVDYVICYLNIPNEDTTMVNGEQKTNVELLFENGVNVILGTGSKVVQGKLEDLYELEDGTKNHAYVVYSLGDFYGSMDSDGRKVSIGMDITFTKSITKDKEGNIVLEKTKKNMMFNPSLSFYTKVTKDYKTTNYPINKTIEEYDNGNLKLDSKDYEKIKEAQDEIKKILE